MRYEVLLFRTKETLIEIDNIQTKYFQSTYYSREWSNIFSVCYLSSMKFLLVVIRDIIQYLLWRRKITELLNATFPSTSFHNGRLHITYSSFRWLFHTWKKKFLYIFVLEFRYCCTITYKNIHILLRYFI